ncbi:MAG: cell wall lytic [Paenibacillus sp.]|nr:cell wall lytic [Paenibacillus sp.]
MNRYCKKLILSCVFSSVGLLALFQPQAVQAAQAASYEVKVQVNDSLVSFPDAQPFIDNTGNLQIPLRLLIEKLGYQMEWSKENEVVKVTLTNNKQTISLQTGDNKALIDGKSVKLDAPAQFIKGRVYLPLRFVSETFGYRVQWDANNRIAIINADGLYHAPAWYKPKPIPPIIQTAYNYLGTSYSWGGRTPNGFDCSGYVGYIFQLNGVKLPRTSVEMFDKAGERVNDLKEGDLVFFAEGNKTSHVGIYLGNEQFISAANSYGVSVASLTTGYWSKKYVGAKRVTAQNS